MTSKADIIDILIIDYADNVSIGIWAFKLKMHGKPTKPPKVPCTSVSPLLWGQGSLILSYQCMI